MIAVLSTICALDLSPQSPRLASSPPAASQTNLLQWDPQRCRAAEMWGATWGENMRLYLQCPAVKGGSVPAPTIPSFVPLLTGGAQLIIVGDSLSLQQYVSLVCWHENELNWTATLERRVLEGHCSAENRSRDATFVLRGGGVLKFVMNDALADPVLNKTTNSSPGRTWPEYDILAPGNCSQAAPRRESWSGRLRSGQTGERDVVVFNAGPHWSAALGGNSPADVKMPLYTKMVDAVLDTVASSNFRGAVFYRSNFPAGCTRAPDAWMHGSVGRYGWWLFPLFDKVWKQRSAERSGITILNGFNRSQLTGHWTEGHCYRDCSASGKHPDCLHFCLSDGVVMHGPNLELASAILDFRSRHS